MKRDQINPKIEEEVINDFLTFFAKKMNKKGRNALVSLRECTQYVAEESQEVAVESHAKDHEKMILELRDVATAALLGIMSIKVMIENKEIIK